MKGRMFLFAMRLGEPVPSESLMVGVIWMVPNPYPVLTTPVREEKSERGR